MYEIRPETLKSFIEDVNIKLPRFQRKQTWDDKKNFELVISIFKEYPIGVCILNIEENDGIKTRWLLDGRQRRNALSQFYSDPESVYSWAKKYIKIKSTDQPQDIESKFWSAIDLYLEEDQLEEEDENTDCSQEDTGITSTEEQTKNDSSKAGFSLLLNIIKLTHNKSQKYSGFTRPFDFSNEIDRLPYLETNDNGKKSLNSRKLKSFINEYKAYCSNESLKINQWNNFYMFLDSRFSLSEDKKSKIEKKIEQSWENIFERIEILERITNIYNNSKIGVIEVKNLKSVDSQKIFNIINSNGTQLSAVEILSAKPSWNKIVDNLSAVQQDVVKKLYEEIKVENDNVVKWDLPATLLNRLNHAPFFFKKFADGNTDFSKSITLGFKLISGIFEGGVHKDSIDDLGRNMHIKWDSDFESTVQDLNQMHKLVLTHSYFKFLKSWEFSFTNHLSDAISLNFSLLAYKDWVRKGKPIGNDTKTKTFQKNTFILLDSLIYEYVTKMWRGSSDSRIRNNLRQLESNNDQLSHINSEKWKELLDEIFDKSTIDGSDINQKLMQTILYHCYALSGISSPDTSCPIEVDHIIPQAIFKTSVLERKEIIMHNLFNLGLLPKNENIRKGDKPLATITDKWLISQIEKYEFIEENQFRKFSDLNELEELKEHRKSFFYKALDEGRNKILNN